MFPQVIDIAASSDVGSPFSHIATLVIWVAFGMAALLAGAIAVRVSQRRLSTGSPSTSTSTGQLTDFELAAA